MTWLRRFWKHLSPDRSEKTFQFVRIRNADDYLKCGWIPHDSLKGTPHGEYSVLMEYIDCGCRPMPRPEQRSASAGGNPGGGEHG